MPPVVRRLMSDENKTHELYIVFELRSFLYRVHRCLELLEALPVEKFETSEAERHEVMKRLIPKAKKPIEKMMEIFSEYPDLQNPGEEQLRTRARKQEGYTYEDKREMNGYNRTAESALGRCIKLMSTLARKTNEINKKLFSNCQDLIKEFYLIMKELYGAHGWSGAEVDVVLGRKNLGDGLD